MSLFFDETIKFEVDSVGHISIYVGAEEVVYGCETLQQAIELFDCYLKEREQ